MKRLALAALLSVLCSLSAWSFADQKILVVTNKNAPVESMTRSQVIDLFMGKFVAFPSGSKATPVDINGNAQVKGLFYQKLVKMPLARVNAYWSRIKFTGRARPPIGEDTVQQVVEYLSQNENAIGYIPADAMTDKLKAVYEFNE